MAEPHVKDLLLVEIFLEKEVINNDVVARARRVFDEMHGHGIQKSLLSCLLEEGVVDHDVARGMVKTIGDFTVRCAHCRTAVTLGEVDRRGLFSCPRCGAKSSVTLARGEAPARDRLKTELEEGPPSRGFLEAGMAETPTPIPADRSGPTPMPFEFEATPRSVHVDSPQAIKPVIPRLARPTRRVDRAPFLRRFKRSGLYLAVVVSLATFAGSLIVLGWRYNCWAQNTATITAEKVLKAAAQEEEELLLTKRSHLTAAEFNRRARAMMRAYEGTEAVARLKLLVTPEEPAVNPDIVTAKQAMNAGQIASAIKTILSAGLTPAASPALWDDLRAAARRTGQLVVLEAQLDVPGEAPRRLKPFLISTQPVSNKAYGEFVAKTGVRPPPTWPNGTVPRGKELEPVTGLSFGEAQRYAKWCGQRLPGEGELRSVAGSGAWKRFEWVREEGFLPFTLAMAPRAGGFRYRRFSQHARVPDVAFRLVEVLGLKYSGQP